MAVDNFFSEGVLEEVAVQAVIQARSGSIRLPEKIFFRIGEKSILEWVVARLTASKRVERIVVATTTSPADDEVEALAESLGVSIFRGDEEDVLDRFYHALEKYPSRSIIRATADNPLLDTATVDSMIDASLAGGYDHTGALGPIPLGLTAEVVLSSAICAAWRETTLKSHREHVTPYIYTNPEKFRLFNIPAPLLFGGKTYRLTVDTDDDYKLMRRIYDRLAADGLPFNAVEAVRLLDSDRELARMNAQVVQKDWRD